MPSRRGSISLPSRSEDASKEDELPQCVQLAQLGDVEGLKQAIESNCDVNARAPNGATPLMIAIHYGADMDAINLILDHPECELDLQSESGLTALHVAAKEGDPDILKSLLDHNADVEAKDEDEETAVFKAAAQGHVKCLKSMLDKGTQLMAASPLTSPL